MHLSCDLLLTTNVSLSLLVKEVFKTGEHLAKLRTKWLIVLCATFALRFFPPICRTRHICRITCV